MLSAIVRIPRFGSDLVFFSDVDTILRVKPVSKSSNAALQQISNTRLLQAVASQLKAFYENVKTRLRVARGGDLFILTVKLLPQTPPIDILLCLVNFEGIPINEASTFAMEAILVSEEILEVARSAPSLAQVDAVRVFQGALRLIKLWAYNREVYGASMGFLGGGGWATFFA